MLVALLLGDDEREVQFCIGHALFTRYAPRCPPMGNKYGLGEAKPNLRRQDCRLEWADELDRPVAVRPS